MASSCSWWRFVMRFQKVNKMSWAVHLCVAALCAVFALVSLGCEKDTDGPLDVSDESANFQGEGFFYFASLDSSSNIHLYQDTLFLQMGKIWSFNNCSLQKIDLNYSQEDSVLWISPVIKIKSTSQDCAAPYYRPDTLLKLDLNGVLNNDIATIKVRNDVDSVLDSILVRQGAFQRDSFDIYLDSSFSDAHRYPLRANVKGSPKNKPSILRVLDSLTPRVFYWKTMESRCTHRVDMCKSVVPDTLYPSSWSLNDTNLVPIHYACADSDSVYCINSKWENDSTALGKLQERPDTIWHYSTYYMEKIARCGTYNSFNVKSFYVGSTVRFTRDLLKPADGEAHCGPSSNENWMIYRLPSNKLVTDTDSAIVVDSLLQLLDRAEVAPESLVVKDTL